MQINKDFTIQKVGASYVAVPVGETSKTFHGMVRLNETGAFLWRYFQEEHTLEEGIAALLGEYEVDEELAKADVERFMQTLMTNGFAE
jgi:hypothetical protein